MYDNEKILLNYLGKNITDVFEGSYRAIDIFDDAIAFAYGWLMLAFSIDDKFLILKLQNMNDSKNTKDCSFVKSPIIQISKTLSIDFETTSLLKLDNLDTKKDYLMKILVSRFNQFLIDFHTLRLKFSTIEIDQRKELIEDLVVKIIK